MGRRADDYHVMMDGRDCPSNRTFLWTLDGRAQCTSCGKVYSDHVRDETRNARGEQSARCIICREDHGR